MKLDFQTEEILLSYPILTDVLFEIHQRGLSKTIATSKEELSFDIFALKGNQGNYIISIRGKYLGWFYRVLIDFPLDHTIQSAENAFNN